MSTIHTSGDLRDGHAYAIPCPAERHATDADPPMLHVRYLTTHRAWILHCWARPECDYVEIAQLLGIGADTDRQQCGLGPGRRLRPSRSGRATAARVPQQAGGRRQP